MYFNLALLSTLFAGVSASKAVFGKNTGAIKANSELGNKVLSQARRLDGDDDAAEDMTWAVDYSIKFQGCHHTLQYNEDADEDEDVRVYTKRLVRFSLCPSDYCVDGEAAACDGSGEYVIDMATFVNAYTEYKMDYEEYQCEQVRENCDCENDDDAIDDEQCEATCYTNAGLYDQCVENEDDAEEFNVQEYLECAQAEFAQDDDANNRRRLDAEEEAVEYFIGPYCSEQGGGVYLGMFTDDSCSVFADDNGGRDTYETSSNGESLPYSSESIVGLDCLSCLEPQDAQNDGDAQDEDQVREVCGDLYMASGKCESNLSANGKYSDSDENACTYISGIQIIRTDGVVNYVSSSTSGAMNGAIGFFAVAFVLLGGYVFYLHGKVSRTNVDLS